MPKFLFPQLFTSHCELLCFRLFCNNTRGPQAERFIVAAGKAAKELKCATVVFEEMTPKLLRENSMSVSDFVDWLLGSHCHFVICHAHQNNAGLVGWGVDELYTEFQRLKYHRGWPNGIKLKCPIFVQDKDKYLRAMPANFVLPTLTIPLSRELWNGGDLSSTMDEVRR